HARPRGGRDDPDRHRAVEAEGVADRDGPLADPEMIGIAHVGRRRRAGRVDVEHGDVGLRVATHELGGELPLIGETHDDLLSVLDHVVVRQDVSLWIHQDARAGGARVLARTPAEVAVVELVAEELAEALRVFFGRAGGASLLHRAHVHDRRRDAVGHRAERILHRAQDPLGVRLRIRPRIRLGIRLRSRMRLRRGRALRRPGGRALGEDRRRPRPRGRDEEQGEDQGDEWIHQGLGLLLYWGRSGCARGTSASSSTRRVRAVTRPAAPRRRRPIQTIVPPASITGTRLRSQRGTLASIRSVLRRRSAPRKATKRSPRRLARTTSGVASSSASNATRPCSRGIAYASAPTSRASSAWPISGSSVRPGTTTIRSISAGGGALASRASAPLTSTVTPESLNARRGAGTARTRLSPRCAHARSGARLPRRAA